MANTSPSNFEAGPPRDGEPAIEHGLGPATSGSRDRIEDDIVAWIAELSVEHATSAREPGVSGSARIAEARARLTRLEEALRRAPGRMLDRLRQHTDEFASTHQAQLLRIVAHEATERTLTALNAHLRQEIDERRRLEREGKRAERGLREVRERFESAFDNAPIGMALIAMDNRWLQVNGALCRITGRTPDELRSTTLPAITHPDDLEVDAESRGRLLAGEIASDQVEKRYLHAQGHFVWVQVTTSVVRDEERKPLHSVVQVQDISERRELARRLEYVVDHDFLTGLLNRRHFEQEVEREAERAARYGVPGAVLLIDLDNFKGVNDRFGHHAGDEVLKGVAGILRQRLRHTDLIARVGGDEFAVLLPQTDADQVQIVADEVVKALARETAALANQSIRLSASIGGAMFEGLTDVEVMACADIAMYEAKETGRNRFEMYRPLKGGRERASARFIETDRVRTALETDRLILHGQPILDLATNAISQYELLLRLPGDDPEAPLPPSAFLYHAERSGLIQSIDAWVVRRAIAMIVEHSRAGRRLVLNVNLSGRSIGDRRLADLIEQELAASGIDPAQLVFELTETAAISNIEEAKAFAGRLQGRGCRLALDDFGAGFGSFYYLKSFPFDYLKIDGDFIRDLAANPMNRLVVSALVGIARGMGKQTVAEFVADQETADLLRTLGVDYAQGYHIGMPTPVAELLATPGAMAG